MPPSRLSHRTMPFYHQERHRSCLSFELVGTSFAALLSTSNDWDALHDSSAALNQLYNLIYYYASEVYGRTAIRTWLKANQERSVLDKMTASDLAFALIVFENYYPKWVAEIQDTREQEQRRHDDHVADPHDDETGKGPPKKKRKTSVTAASMTLKYTQDQKQKKVYLGCGWKPEGLKHYEYLQNLFAGLLANVPVWQNCKDGWDLYIEEKKRNDDIKCWVPTYHIQCVDNIYDGENSSGEEEGFEFVLGGSEGIEALGTTVMVPELNTSARVEGV